MFRLPISVTVKILFFTVSTLKHPSLLPWWMWAGERPTARGRGGRSPLALAAARVSPGSLHRRLQCKCVQHSCTAYLFRLKNFNSKCNAILGSFRFVTFAGIIPFEMRVLSKGSHTKRLSLHFTHSWYSIFLQPLLCSQTQSRIRKRCWLDPRC